MSRLRRGLATLAVCALGAAVAVAVPQSVLAAEPGVRINEVESSGGSPGDWVEFYNPTSAPIALDGYLFKDSEDTRTFAIPAGTTVEPGGYYVLDEKGGVGNFDFGLGAADSARLFTPAGELVDERSWTAHAATTLGVRDGATPDWQVTSESTKGAANVFAAGEPTPGPTTTPTSTPTATPTPTSTPTPPVTLPSDVVINEIVYDAVSGLSSDQVEFYNTGTAAVDLTGWKMSDDNHTRFGEFPAGTILQPGEFFMMVNGVNFTFGLGKGDEVVLYDPSGAVRDSYLFANTAPIAVWARCPDGTGDWAPATKPTPGAANVCEPLTAAGSIRINEIDSAPADWVEFYNPGTEAFDISGYEIRDNSDDHRWSFLPGTSIAAGQYLVVEASTIGLVAGAEKPFSDPIGIGSADRIRLFDQSGELVDDTLPWQGHAAIEGDEAAATLARCPDGVGAFRLAHVTKGASNACVLPKVAINEVESGGDATDWVEIVNLEQTPVDISGWTLMDNDPIGHAADVAPLPAGTMLAPGAFFVFDGGTHFTFGLGAADTATIRDAGGLTVAEYSWTAHATGVYARCADGVGEFGDNGVSTKGERNACGNPVRINEVESDGGSPDDWIELVNPSKTAIDVSGIVVKDSDDANVYTIPAGTTIAGEGYLVIERAALGFGLGGTDAVRLFENGEVIDETGWTGHAATTWGRCPDVRGPFGVTFASTKGAANVCEAPPVAWPGASETRVLDETAMFLEDSSGLDTQVTADGTFLWAVDNGTGTFWRLAVAADGSVTKAAGWENGKRARFQKDAADPSAAGPDTEGITVAGDGFVYLASERDNSNKGVNQNVVLKLDPSAPGPDFVSTQEWDLTAKLPAVSANTGLEAIEWIADTDLEKVLIDQNTSAMYDPARYPGHGGGLFFAAMEDNGHIYAFALNADGTSTLVAEIVPGLPAVMALDWDTSLDVLWAVCDDGCDGAAEQITLNGTATPGLVRVAPPAGLPNTNNEGFATLPTASTAGSSRAAWWFTDGVKPGALRLGSLPYVAGPVDPEPTPQPTSSPTASPSPDPTGTPSPEPSVTPSPEPTGAPQPTTGPSPEPTSLPTTGPLPEPTSSAPPTAAPGGVQPLPASGLTGDNRGDVTAPSSAVAGSPVTVSVGAQFAGREVEVWMYSTPVRIGTGTLDAAGRISVAIPADAPAGSHRLVVYATDGTLLGWAAIEVARTAASALPATGGDAPSGLLWLGGLLLAAGATAVLVRRRVVRAAR